MLAMPIYPSCPFSFMALLSSTSSPTLYNSLDLRSTTTKTGLELLFGVLFLVALLEAFYYSFDRLITTASQEMANQQLQGSGLKWPPRRLLLIHRRGLIIASMVFFILSLICFIRVATIETAKLERRALAGRQFQLGGYLGGMFREVRIFPSQLCTNYLSDSSFVALVY